MNNNTDELVIRESYPRYYFYHLAKNGKSLCGYENEGGTRTTMPTSIPVKVWGYVGGLNEKYCKRCEHLSGIGDSDANSKILGE